MILAVVIHDFQCPSCCDGHNCRQATLRKASAIAAIYNLPDRHAHMTLWMGLN